MKRRRYFQNITKRQLYKEVELNQRLNKIFNISFNNNVLK